MCVQEQGLRNDDIIDDEEEPTSGRLPSRIHRTKTAETSKTAKSPRRTCEDSRWLLSATWIRSKSYNSAATTPK